VERSVLAETSDEACAIITNQNYRGKLASAYDLAGVHYTPADKYIHSHLVFDFSFSVLLFTSYYYVLLFRGVSMDHSQMNRPTILADTQSQIRLDSSF
jgi:hypothetical protein